MAVPMRSTLHDSHERLGARFTDFGGWEMPLQYAGTLAEHQAVRTGCGVFDVSHLGRFELSGPGARDLIGSLLCNDLARIEPGRAQYTMMLTPEGGVIDDIIVWWLEDQRLVILPNGVNHQAVMEGFSASGEAEVADLRPETALLAVQGPEAPGILSQVLGEAPRRFRVLQDLGPQAAVVAAGTGYTGEAGAELLVPAADAASLLEDLIGAGATPCGLGARDTLRLEMGFPLWGQDLDRTTSPLEAGMGWVVGWDHDFVGKDSLAAQRAEGVKRSLIGFRLPGRSIPRHGYPLRCGASTGSVASGNYSPTLQCGIGMGYLSPPPGAEAETVEVEIRGNWKQATIVEPPFIER